MPRYDDNYGGYRDYRERPPRQPQRPAPRYPDEEDYDYEYPPEYYQQPPYYATPYGGQPQRPPHNRMQPPSGYPEQDPYYQSQYGNQRPPQRPPRNNNRPRYGNRPPQRQYDNRPQRPRQQRDDDRPPRQDSRPARRVPDVGFNPGTFSLELGDVVKHRTTGLEMTVIRFGREQLQCRIHADMSPNWFYESELDFVRHEGEPPEEETENDDPQ